MKTNLLIYLVLAIITSACVDDVEHVEEQFPQQWQLVRMTGIQGETGKYDHGLAWKEFYLLNPDGTFLKSRLDGGDKTSATGMYAFTESGDEEFLVFTYTEPSEIIGSCTSDLTETLQVLSSSILIGTWSACDGPGLEYFRVQ